MKGLNLRNVNKIDGKCERISANTESFKRTVKSVFWIGVGLYFAAAGAM